MSLTVSTDLQQPANDQPLRLAGCRPDGSGPGSADQVWADQPAASRPGIRDLASAGPAVGHHPAWRCSPPPCCWLPLCWLFWFISFPSLGLKRTSKLKVAQSGRYAARARRSKLWGFDVTLPRNFRVRVNPMQKPASLVAVFMERVPPRPNGNPSLTVKAGGRRRPAAATIAKITDPTSRTTSYQRGRLKRSRPRPRGGEAPPPRRRNLTSANSAVRMRRVAGSFHRITSNSRPE
jgi:hypothetical protein